MHRGGKYANLHHLGSAVCVQATCCSLHPNQEVRERESIDKSADANAAGPADLGMD